MVTGRKSRSCTAAPNKRTKSRRSGIQDDPDAPGVPYMPISWDSFGGNVGIYIYIYIVKSTRDTTRSVVESEGTFIAQEKGKRPIGFSLGREGSPLYIYIYILSHGVSG